MTNATRFDAKATRRYLLERRLAEISLAERDGSIQDLKLLKRNLTRADTEKYCYRPFDLRWLYWESRTKLLDEKREDYWRAHVPEGLALASAQSNRRAYDPPCVSDLWQVYM